MIFAKVKQQGLGGHFIECLENSDVSIEEFEQFLNTEEQFAACRDIDGKYYGAGFVAIEFFGSLTYQEIMENSFIKANASFVIKMGRDEDNDFIVIFCLEEAILNSNKHGKILRKLQDIFPIATVEKPEHIFFNYGLSSIYSIGNILSNNIVNLMTGDY